LPILKQQRPPLGYRRKNGSWVLTLDTMKKLWEKNIYAICGVRGNRSTTSSWSLYCNSLLQTSWTSLDRDPERSAENHRVAGIHGELTIYCVQGSCHRWQCEALLQDGEDEYQDVFIFLCLSVPTNSLPDSGRMWITLPWTAYA
jgi:hypothetical protein